MALPPPVTEVPLREAVERYLEACRAKARAQSMAPATVKNYTWDLERFLDLLPGTVLHTTESVTGEEIDQALRAFAHGTDHHAGTTTALGQRSRVPGPVTDTDVTVSRSTLRMRRSIARFFTYAVEQSWATVTPPAWLPNGAGGGDSAAARTDRLGRRASPRPAHLRTRHRRDQQAA